MGSGESMGRGQKPLSLGITDACQRFTVWVLSEVFNSLGCFSQLGAKAVLSRLYVDISFRPHDRGSNPSLGVSVFLTDSRREAVGWKWGLVPAAGRGHRSHRSHFENCISVGPSSPKCLMAAAPPAQPWREGRLGRLPDIGVWFGVLSPIVRELGWVSSLLVAPILGVHLLN